MDNLYIRTFILYRKETSLSQNPVTAAADAVYDFISLGNELKPERFMSGRAEIVNFISLGNELKPELGN